MTNIPRFKGCNDKRTMYGRVSVFSNEHTSYCCIDDM